MTSSNNYSKDSRWLRFLPNAVSRRLFGRYNLQAVLGNSIWQVTDKIIRMGVAVFVSLWVARYLNPYRFGQLNYALALTSVFQALASLGIDSIVIRELVRSPDKRDILLGSSFILKLIGSCLTLIVVIAFVSVFRAGDRLILLLTVLSAAGFLFQALPIDLYFQSRVQSKFVVLSTSGAFLLTAVAKVVLILLRSPLVAFAWAGFFELLLAAIFMLIAYRVSHHTLWEWKYSMAEMNAILKESWPLLFSGISVMISMRVDQVIIGQLLSDRDVGLYSAAVKLSELWYFMPVAMAASTFPTLVESKRQNEGLYYRRLQKLYDILVSLGIAVAIVMTLLSGPIVRVLYGSEYAESSGALRILIWSGVPVCFGCAWTNWMILENRARMLFYLQLTGAVVNLFLNLFLIPRFGIAGSAFATLISYWIGITIIAALFKRLRPGLLMLGKAMVSFPGLLRIQGGNELP